MRHALLLAGSLLLSAAVRGQFSCSSSFVSPQAHHVSYSLVSHQTDLISLRLQVAGPGTTAVVAEGGAVLHGHYRLNTSVGGSYTFTVEETYNSMQGVQVARTPVHTAIATTQVQGTCLYDETISGNRGPLGDLTVPGGIRLELNSWQDTDGRDVMLSVDGVLLVDGLSRPGGSTSVKGTGATTLRGMRSKGSLYAQGEGILEIVGSRIDGYVGLQAAELRLEDSLLTFDPPGFIPGVTLRSTSRTELVQTELLGSDVLLEGGPATVRNCVFRRILILGESLQSMPNIQDNSFFGVGAVQGGHNGWTLTQPNYFGDRAGSVETGWLGFQGAISAVPSFQVFNSHGPGRVCSLPDDRPAPWIRVEGRYGQNVLERSGSPTTSLVRPRAGRSTLFCFNLIPAAESVAGVRYKLRLGGIDYAPLNPGHVARRDHGGPFYPTDPDRTLNFVVPDTVTAGTYTASLLADLSNCGGYEPGLAEANIWEEPVVFDAAFGRPLRIGIAAVSIDVPGYVRNTDAGNPANNRESSLSKVTTRLMDDLLTHWPLLEHEVQITDVGPYAFEGTFLGTGLAQLSSVGFAYTLAAELEDLRNNYNATAPNPLDVIVAIVPGTALGAANEGASMRGFRAVALVDEGSPGAALHELGHALGLYAGVGSEQYDLDTGDDGAGNLILKGSGARLQAVTAFNSSQRTTKAFSGELWHFPARMSTGVFDFMGAKEPHWIVPSSLNSVYPALRELLGTQASTAPAAPPQPQLKPMGGNSSRWVRVRGLYVYDPAPLNGAGYRRLLKESIQITDWSATESATPVEGATFLDAHLQALDAQGNSVAIRACRAASSVYPRPGDPAPFMQVFEIPGDAVLLKLWNTTAAGQPTELLAIRSAVKQPSLHGTLTSTFTTQGVELRWQTPADTLRRPLKAQLHLNRGQGWTPVATPSFTNAVILPTNDLAGPLQFQLVLANAFDSAALDAPPLIVHAQPPTLQLLRPRPGDVGDTNRLWHLEAVTPANATCSWWSSRDGLLGDGPQPGAVRLSQGAHTLRCIATSGELSRTGSVSVTVGPVDTADLQLEDASLSIVPDGLDLTQQDGPRRLIPNRNTRIRLALHNPGITNAVRVQLAATRPGQPHQSLIDTLYTPRFQEDIRLDAEFVPQPGAYTFLGSIHAPDLPDPVPANNSRSWVLTNQPPVAYGTRLTTTPGQALDLHLTGYDPELGALSHRVLLQPTLGQLTGNGPNRHYLAGARPGTDRFTFSVSDGALESAPATVLIHILEPSAPGTPVFTETILTGVQQGTPLNYALRTANDPLDFTTWGLPRGLTLDRARGILTGIPEVAGNQAFTIIAWNDIGATTQALSGWFASGTPVVTSIPSAAAVVGLPFQLRLTSTPAAESYLVSGLPAGLGLDPASGWITGTTSQEGSYTLGVTASNRWGNGYQLLQFAVVQPAQAQDFFSLRQILAGTTPTHHASTLLATREIDEPYHAGNFQLQGSVWWTWTAPHDGPVTLTTEGSDFDTVLAVYTGTNYPNLVPVVANDNFRWEITSLVFFEAKAGTAYQIAVDGTAHGNVSLALAYHPQPLITSPVTYRAIATQPFSHQLQARNSPTSFGAQGLPQGFTIGRETGLVSGTGTTKGGAWITLTATNAHGSDSLRAYLEIMSAQYPVFSCPPHAAAVYGQPFAFNATATHATAGYRAWPLPSGLSLDPVSGRISGTPWAAGAHSITLDASNDLGELAVFDLVINVRLPYDLWLQNFILPSGKDSPTDDADGDGMTNDHERLCGTNPQDPQDALVSAITANTGGYALTWTSVPGFFYRVASAPALEGPWTEGPAIKATGPTCTQPVQAPSTRFWRVVLDP